MNYMNQNILDFIYLWGINYVWIFFFCMWSVYLIEDTEPIQVILIGYVMKDTLSVNTKLYTPQENSILTFTDIHLLSQTPPKHHSDHYGLTSLLLQLSWWLVLHSSNYPHADTHDKALPTLILWASCLQICSFLVNINSWTNLGQNFGQLNMEVSGSILLPSFSGRDCPQSSHLNSFLEDNFMKGRNQLLFMSQSSQLVNLPSCLFSLSFSTSLFLTPSPKDYIL